MRMMKRSRLVSSILVTVALAGLSSPAVQACAVCFGRTDSPLGKGLHWGVFALLCFVILMLTAFGAFAVYLVRRSMAVEAIELESGQDEHAAVRRADEPPAR